MFLFILCFYLFSLSPQGGLLHQLFEKSEQGVQKDLIMTRPSEPTESLQKIMVDQIYKKLLFYSQTNKVLLIGIDLSSVSYSFISKTTLLLLDKLKYNSNIYFLDVSYDDNQLVIPFQWKDKVTRYFSHRKEQEGLFELESDYNAVNDIINQIQPDRIIFFGYTFNICLYATIQSWFLRFLNRPVELILSLSMSVEYSVVSLLKKDEKDKKTILFVDYLKNKNLSLFDLDFYEEDKRYVGSVPFGFFCLEDADYQIIKLISTDCFVIWRLKSEKQIKELDLSTFLKKPLFVSDSLKISFFA